MTIQLDRNLIVNSASLINSGAAIFIASVIMSNNPLIYIPLSVVGMACFLIGLGGWVCFVVGVLLVGIIFIIEKAKSRKM